MLKLSEWYRRNYGLLVLMVGIAGVLVALAGVLLANPKLIDPLVKVADSVLPSGTSFIRDGAPLVLSFLAGAASAIAIQLAVKEIRGGAQSRKFVALSDRIARSKSNLLELEKGRLPNESENEYGSRAVGILNEVLSLGLELAKLRILVPPFIESNFNNMTIWIVFLTNLEGMAQRGDYKIAVEFSMAFHRQVFEASEDDGPA